MKYNSTQLVCKIRKHRRSLSSMSSASASASTSVMPAESKPTTELSCAEIIARARALPTTASRAERDVLLSMLTRARLFAALVAKHGSHSRACAVLSEIASESAAAREREIAWISCPVPSRPVPQTN